MGLETVLFASLVGLQAVSKMGAAKTQAKAVKRNAESQAEALRVEGELASKEKAKQIRYAAARQTSSFLSSGITLDGTPSDVLGETFKTGFEDIENIKRGYNTNISNVVSNANAQSKNIISSARSDIIGDIAGSFAGSSFGSSMFNTTKFALGTGEGFFQGMGNIAGAAQGKYGPGF